MKPFCIVAIGTILGIIMGLYFNSIAFFVLAILAFLFSLLAIKMFPIRISIQAVLILFICFFSFWGYTYFLERSHSKINQIYDNQEVEIQAIVVSDKTKKDYKDVYQIRIVAIDLKQKKLGTSQNFNMLLNLKHSKNVLLDLKYGDKICFTGIYETPDKARNEGGFDYSQYLKTKKIIGVITVKSSEVQILQKDQMPIVNRMLHTIKHKAIERVKEILPENTANLCTGLLLGEKKELAEDIQESFRKSSLSHILAISGAHVSYVLLGFTTLFQKLRIHKRWSKIFLIFFLIFFMALVRIYPICYKSLHHGNFTIASRSTIKKVRYFSKFSY